MNDIAPASATIRFSLPRPSSRPTDPRVEASTRSSGPPLPAPAPRLPRATRALVQAHALLRLLARDPSCSLATLARDFGTSRARISQLLDLTLLAPDIQERILHLAIPASGRERLSEHMLRRVTRSPDWQAQRAYLDVAGSADRTA